MPQFRRILLPIHFDRNGGSFGLAMDAKKAVRIAASLAHDLAVPVSIAHVFANVETEPFSDDGHMPAFRVELTKLEAELAAEGVDASWEFLFGDPAGEIVSLANRGATGLVVMGTRQEAGAGGRFVGSTASQVMLASDVPVIVARNYGTGSRCAIIATDLTHECDGALACGLEIARARGSEVIVVHACDDPAITSDETGLGRLRAKVELQLARVLDGADPPSGLATAVGAGTPANVIWTMASQHHADLVVMGMGGRTGAERVLRGNTAEVVLEDLRCSLMTVRS